MRTNYVVLRVHPDLPAGFVPPEVDGKWFNLLDMSIHAIEGMAVAVPTGRFEVREDGAVAEVWEFQP